MKTHLLKTIASCTGGLLLGLTTAACGETAPPGPGGQLAIDVAPLTLAGVQNVCYAIEVRNGDGERVWTQAHVCADRFGNASGGDISYIGPCDASSGDGDQDGTPTSTHEVVVAIENLYTDEAPWADDPLAAGDTAWVNPCPGGVDASGALLGGCSLPAECRENADTPVVFNFTVMREANQGFFDVAVNFEDIFCSAKFDCESADGGPLTLLHDPESGERIPTAVATAACTSGSAASPTHIYFDQLLVTCGTTIIPIPIAEPDPGNVYDASDLPPDLVRQVATYRGVETLTAPGGASLGKIFYNIAFALDLAALSGPCSASLAMTASEGPLATPFTTPADAFYPVVRYEIPDLVVSGAQGFEYGCGANALNDPSAPEGTGVFTTYAEPDAPRSFFVDAWPIGAPGDGLSIATNSTPVAGTLSSDGESGLTYLEGVRLEVRLSPDGAPFSTGVTEADGGFSLSIPPSGDWYLYANEDDLRAIGSDGLWAGQVIPGAELTDPSAIALDAVPPSFIEGYAFAGDHDGQYHGESGNAEYVAGLEIEITDVATGATRVVITDAAGFYRFPAAVGYFELRVPAGQAALAGYAGAWAEPSLAYSNGGGGVSGWDLALDRIDTFIIEGYVAYTYPDGRYEPVEQVNGFEVQLWDVTDPTPQLVAVRTTATDGNYGPGYYLFGDWTSGVGLVLEGRRYELQLAPTAEQASGIATIDTFSGGSYLYDYWQNGNGAPGPHPLQFDAMYNQVDFGLTPPNTASITIEVPFADLDGNGSFDAGVDVRITGQDVNVYGPDWSYEYHTLDAPLELSDLYPYTNGGWGYEVHWQNTTSQYAPFLPMDMIQGGPTESCYGGAGTGSYCIQVGPGQSFDLSMYAVPDPSLLSQHRITGVVLDPNDAPLDGATVSLTPVATSPDGSDPRWDSWPAMAQVIPTRTAPVEAGGYLFDQLVSGRYRVALTTAPAGYELDPDHPSACEIVVSSEEMNWPEWSCDFRLRPMVTIAGAVRNSTGWSIAGLTVDLTRNEAGGGSLSTVTTEAGWQFGPIASGNYTIAVDPTSLPAGYEVDPGSASCTVDVGHGLSWPGCDLRIRPSALPDQSICSELLSGTTLQVVSVTNVSGGVVFSVGAHASPTIGLPAGASVPTCCANDCCNL